MSTEPRHIELVFPDNAYPGDLHIISQATYDQPGRIELGKARIEAGNSPSVNSGNYSRVYSLNGGAFIGIISAGAPQPPYNFSYWLVEAAEIVPSEEVNRD